MVSPNNGSMKRNRRKNRERGKKGERVQLCYIIPNYVFDISGSLYLIDSRISCTKCIIEF